MALYQHGLVVALGVFLIVIGVVIPKLIEWQVRDSIRSALSVSSPNDSGYNDWLAQNSASSVRKILAYELTNPLQFMGGAAPNFQEWSDAEEVWFTVQKTILQANFSADQTQVRTLLETQFLANADSPGTANKYLLNINWAFLSLLRKFGSEQVLWMIFANVMLGRMFQVSAMQWLTNTTFYGVGTTRGLATYAAAGNSIPSGFGAPQLAAIGALFTAMPSWIAVYAKMITTINNPATPAPVRQAVTAQANALFAFVNCTPPADGGTNDALYFMQYLSDLTTKTAATLTAAYSTTPYGLLFKNTTLYNHVFGVDPLFALLGQTTTFVTNNSRATNTLATGYHDDDLLGMDYYYETSSIFNVTKYPMGNFSVEGRQTSYPPFHDRPAQFSVFFPPILRFANLVYSGNDVTVKRVPAAHFVVSGEDLLKVDARYGTTVRGFLDIVNVTGGAPIWASFPRMAGADPTWTSKITGVPTPDSNQPFTYLNVEPITGLAVEGEAKILFNTHLDLTSTTITGMSAQAGNEYALPLFQIADHRIIGDSGANSLYSAAVTAPKVQRVVLLVLVIIGAILLGVAIITYVIVWWRNRGLTDAELDPLEDKNGGTTDAEMGVTADAPPRSTTSGNSAGNPFDGPVLPKPTAGEEA